MCGSNALACCPRAASDRRGRTPPNAHAEEVWQVAAVLAAALAELEKRDGQPRPMPTGMEERELALADTVLLLLSHGEVRAPFEGTLDVPLPADTDLRGRSPISCSASLRRCLNSAAIRR